MKRFLILCTFFGLACTERPTEPTLDLATPCETQCTLIGYQQGYVGGQWYEKNSYDCDQIWIPEQGCVEGTYTTETMTNELEGTTCYVNSFNGQPFESGCE